MEQLGTVYLLDEDPALVRLVPERYHAAARRPAAVCAYRVPVGTWQPDVLVAQAGESPFGLLVLDGVLLRDVVVAHTTCGELVGPRELLRPWDDFGTRAPMPLEIEWKVLVSARIAVLDQELAHVLAAWPALMNEFVQRGSSGRTRSRSTSPSTASAGSTSVCWSSSAIYRIASARSPPVESR